MAAMNAIGLVRCAKFVDLGLCTDTMASVCKMHDTG